MILSPLPSFQWANTQRSFFWGGDVSGHRYMLNAKDGQEGEGYEGLSCRAKGMNTSKWFFEVGRRACAFAVRWGGRLKGGAKGGQGWEGRREGRRDRRKR